MYSKLNHSYTHIHNNNITATALTPHTDMNRVLSKAAGHMSLGT